MAAIVGRAPAESRPRQGGPRVRLAQRSRASARARGRRTRIVRRSGRVEGPGPTVGVVTPDWTRPARRSSDASSRSRVVLASRGARLRERSRRPRPRKPWMERCPRRRRRARRGPDRSRSRHSTSGSTRGPRSRCREFADADGNPTARRSTTSRSGSTSSANSARSARHVGPGPGRVPWPTAARPSRPPATSDVDHRRRAQGSGRRRQSRLGAWSHADRRPRGDGSDRDLRAGRGRQSHRGRPDASQPTTRLERRDAAASTARRSRPGRRGCRRQAEPTATVADARLAVRSNGPTRMAGARAAAPGRCRPRVATPSSPSACEPRRRSRSADPVADRRRRRGSPASAANAPATPAAAPVVVAVEAARRSCARAGRLATSRSWIGDGRSRSGRPRPSHTPRRRGEVDVDADEVHQLERAHREAGLAHRRVDRLDRRLAGLEHPQRLERERPVDPVDDEARRVGRTDRRPCPSARRARPRARPPPDPVAAPATTSTSAHHRRRVEEVEARRRAPGALAASAIAATDRALVFVARIASAVADARRAPGRSSA